MLTIPGYHYTENDCLHDGKHSLVYRARRIQDDQPVVIKILRAEDVGLRYPSVEEKAKFTREYEAALRVQHVDGVIQVNTLEKHQHTLVMSMEDGGESLDKTLGNCPLELDEFLRLAIEIATILRGIHHADTIHKDINPANIVRDPLTKKVKIIDFGISSKYSREQPEFSAILEGTPAYMAPEQTGRMNRPIDARTDLYSCGATLYHLFTGQLPFHIENPKDLREFVYCQIAQKPEPPETFRPLAQEEHERVLIRNISAIILKLLDKEADKRYQSTFGLIEILKACQEQLDNPKTLTTLNVGQYDRAKLLRIPQKPYGRKEELNTLRQAFERVRNGALKLVLVTGESGIGKTILINELQQPIIKDHGYFIAGKFGQSKDVQNQPYTAIKDAFDGLVERLLIESKPQLELWKKHLNSALGANGAVIAQLIPSIQAIIGTQPVPDYLPPEKDQARLQQTLQKFVQAFATQDHPLVLFLDDLQWADQSSLILLEQLLGDPATCYLLIVGTYRANEVAQDHPLTKTLENVSPTSVTIPLKPFSVNDVQTFMAETLRAEPQRCTLLSEVLHRRTHGNPLFLTHYVEALNEQHLFEFNEQRGEWHWNEEQIRNANIPDDVAELLARNLQQLSEATRQVLIFAAYLGNEFDLHTLALVYQKTQKQTTRDLEEAVREQLIATDENFKYVKYAEDDEDPVNSTCHFMHDQIQHAVDALISEQENPKKHLEIGRLLLQLPKPEREERIVEIVRHLNFGLQRVKNRKKRDKFAKLNLQAGQKIKISAPQQALNCFQTGLAWLGAESWQRQYQRTFDLHVGAAEAAYLSGNFAEMEQKTQVALQHARTTLEKIRIYEVQIEACTAHKKSEESLQFGLQALQLLGITFPEKPDLSYIETGLLEIKSTLTGRRDEDLINQPEMRDEDKLAAVRIILKMGYAAYSSGQNLLVVIISKAIHLVVTTGNTPMSAVVWAGYGLILCGVVGDVESGYRFGQLALQVLERSKSKGHKCQTLAVVYQLIMHWKEHLKTTLQPLLKAYQSGLDTGDLEFAGIAAFAYGYHSFFIGRKLDKLEEEVASYSKQFSQHNQEITFWINEILRQTILNLMDDKAEVPYVLIGDAYNEQDMLPRHLQEERNIVCHVYLNKLILCYLFENYREALENALHTEQYLDGVTSMITVPIFYFYDSLTRLALYTEVSESEQEMFLEKVIANQEKMKTWAHHAPMNFQHKYDLVEAERARVLGNVDAALEYYPEAIDGAEKYGYINEKALAHELLAKFWLKKRRLNTEFCACMLKVRDDYAEWGAMAKVRQLETTYPQAFERTRGHKEDSPEYTQQTAKSETTTSRSAERDLKTVIEVLQILNETDPEKFLPQMLQIVMKHAGATKLVFIERIERRWLIQAEIGKETAPILFSKQSIEESTRVPLTLIHYVINTQKTLTDADLKDAKFAAEPYIQSRLPELSVLCFPIEIRQEVKAILYLEHDQAAEVFTQEKKVELLKLLALQTVVALLDQEVDAANQAKREFIANMSHEIKTPLNTMLSFAQCLEKSPGLTDKQQKEVAMILQSGYQLSTLLSDIVDVSKIEAGQAILEPTEFDLLTMVRNIAEATRNQAQEKGLWFEYNESPLLPQIVWGDEKRLRQILHNLLRNAIKFTPKDGQVILEVRPHQEKIRFQVEDTGIGIPENKLKDIFERFEQVPHEGSHEEGAGLGLAISQGLIQLMGGEIAVKSEEGKGSLFWFDIDLRKVANGPLNKALAILPEDLPIIEGAPFITPAHDILKILLEYARNGNVTGIAKVVTTMKASDPAYIPFAAKIEQLADHFQFEQIAAIIDVLMKGVA